MLLSIDKDLLKSLLVMADIIEARDPYTGGHVWRVSHIVKNLALQAGLSKDEAIYASIGAYIHDLGKVGIPDAILNKAGKLTDSEFETIKTHPVIGANLLNEHPLGELVYDVVIHHHERLDGNGYPHRVDGDALSMNAKIVGLADAFDALTSSRPYRKGTKIDDAIAILTKDSGSHFDPSLVTALQALSHTPELAHIVGHSDEGIPLIDCPACGAVFSISRQTRDGDIAHCRVCTGKHIMHKSGSTFTPEFTGTTGTPQDLLPKPDLDIITDFVLKIPKALQVEHNNQKKPSFFQKLMVRAK
ncbi:MAG: HD domain-containing protein [Chloroflexi bacterium]|nr:HD domain-containing protein [Chloroflexota bacterium]MBI3168794.1 HD domain-containing protein [Chloroflexota bacterium]